MPGGAPPPMQFAPLQFAKKSDKSMGQRMQELGDQAAGLKGPIQNLLNPQAGPNEAVGTPGSQFAGPVAPGTPVPGAPAPAAPQPGPPQPPSPAVPQPMSPGTAGVGAPTPGPDVNSIMRQMSPPVLLDWLKRTAGLGGMQPGLPISAAMQNSALGMMPSGQNPFGAAPMMPTSPVPYT